MPRSFVTGATGFIGTRLVERLVERGDEVACLVRPTSNISQLTPLGVELVTSHLDEEASITTALAKTFGGRGPKAIYHLAGKTHATSLADFCRVNEACTETLCRAAVSQPAPPVVVLVSSLAAAGPSPLGEPHDEQTSSAPISHYGRSKLAGERVARRLISEEGANRLPLSIVRPPVVFGPGDRDGLLLFKTIRRLGFHFVPQRQGLPLSLIYADDLVDALIRVADKGERAMATDETSGLYYAADPAESSYADMGRMAAAAMDRKIWVRCGRRAPLIVPAMVSDLIGKVRGKPPLFGKDKLQEASASGWVCDSKKLAEGLGWTPSAPLAELYRRTYEWYQQTGWL